MENDFNDFPDDDAEGGSDFVTLLPVILWQRKLWILLPTVIGLVAGVAGALLIPPVYRSNAIMLVQSSQLPDEVAGLDSNDVIDRRIARIEQQITARPDLIELIERHGLYVDDRKSQPLSSVIEDMRSAITLTPSQTSVASARSGDQTIAFELAFEYFKPTEAQAVAQDLMDRVLQLDARGSAEQATNTVQFLTDQGEELGLQITDLQQQIAEINARNGGVLAGGSTVIGSGSGTYDIQISTLLRDNQTLTQQRNLAETSSSRDPVVTAAEQRLAAARAVYADSHPDVIFAKQALAEAKELAKSNTAKLPVDTINQQINFNNQQIAALRAARAAEAAQVNSRIAAQSRAPLIQQQLGELQQRLATLNTQNEQVQNQLLAARAGVRADDEQMAERLSVVEPPVVPDEPSWPNRLLLIALGLGGGLGLGFALALAVELFLRPIRDPAALKALIGSIPLGVIPVIQTAEKQGRGWRRFMPSR